MNILAALQKALTPGSVPPGGVVALGADGVQFSDLLLTLGNAPAEANAVAALQGFNGAEAAASASAALQPAPGVVFAQNEQPVPGLAVTHPGLAANTAAPTQAEGRPVAGTVPAAKIPFAAVPSAAPGDVQFVAQAESGGIAKPQAAAEPPDAPVPATPRSAIQVQPGVAPPLTADQIIETENGLGPSVKSNQVQGMPANTGQNASAPAPLVLPQSVRPEVPTAASPQGIAFSAEATPALGSEPVPTAESAPSRPVPTELQPEKGTTLAATARLSQASPSAQSILQSGPALPRAARMAQAANPQPASLPEAQTDPAISPVRASLPAGGAALLKVDMPTAGAAPAEVTTPSSVVAKGAPVTLHQPQQQDMAQVLPAAEPDRKGLANAVALTVSQPVAAQKSAQPHPGIADPLKPAVVTATPNDPLSRPQLDRPATGHAVIERPPPQSVVPLTVGNSGPPEMKQTAQFAVPAVPAGAAPAIALQPAIPRPPESRSLEAASPFSGVEESEPVAVLTRPQPADTAKPPTPLAPAAIPASWKGLSFLEVQSDVHRPILVTPQAELPPPPLGESALLARALDPGGSAAVPREQANTPPPPKPFTEALVSQIKSVDLGEGRTTVNLHPRGLGAVTIEVLTDQDATSKVLVRAENPLVLQALRDDRTFLAQSTGLADPSMFDFQGGQPNGQTGDAEYAQADGLTDRADPETENTSDAQALIANGTLDLLT